ncbi:MAG: mechanosensitive ion channel family protein [Verrucomicrobiales bacterium]|nr:mechanosensitive ion channel family protein [Verrucomicrobiales bacterium]
MDFPFFNSIPERFQPIIDSFSERHEAIIVSAIIIALGFILSIILGRIVIRPWRRYLSKQAMMVLRKGIGYGIFVIVVMMVLQEFDVKLTAILGAAGILGIAIGFAAQTSLSNIISGIFLLCEKPFQVGDVIKVGDETGVVESIDMLSLTLRTFNNLSVRLPNETLVKGQLTNITRHPIRRFDIKLGVSYREDPERVLEVLRSVADLNPHVLVEPEPLIALTGFGESQLDFTLGVWHEKDDFIEMRNSILSAIKKRFLEENIEIPFPHRVVISNPEGTENDADHIAGT